MSRHCVPALVLAVGLAVGGAACSSSEDDSGAVTNLDQLGPDVAKLRLEVQHLRQEVLALREELATVTQTTDPTTGLPLETDPTTGLPIEPTTTTAPAEQG